MAGKSNADTRPGLSVELLASPPPPIPKDMQGSDNSIPLSPQWLLPKPGDNKIGIESHVSSYHGIHPDAMKASGNGENFHDAEKKKDVFRPSFHDTENARRDRWREEERETNFTIRRDRWREGDKELGDPRKAERWTDTARHAGDARRPPSERRNDSGNKESNYEQRRESKWNTRWGPDDKESESWREKSDFGRENEVSREKGTAHVSNYGRETINHGKDTDKEGDQYSRSWRSNSFARGKGEGVHSQAAPIKQAGPFSFSRGRGDNGPTLFSAGRGRATSTSSFGYPGASCATLGNAPDKSDRACADTCTLRYSRMELLDIYRMTDMRSKKILQNAFIDVPPLTLEELLEPLALIVPTSEESAVLKGIDKGDVISSGVVSQGSKDISVGAVSTNTAASKLNKQVIRSEDILSSIDGFPGRNTSTIDPFIKSPLPPMSKSIREHSFEPLNCSFSEESSREPGATWSHPMENDTKVELKPAVFPTPFYKEESNRQNSEAFYTGVRRDPVIKNQPSEILDHLPHQEDTFMPSDKSLTRKFLSYPPPEELQLCYKDPQGQVQGPFSGSDLIGWFETGYFGIDLQVRFANARADAPFLSLGDVMPHLRMKARPPPGFGVTKSLDGIEDSSRGMVTTCNSYPDATDVKFYKNIQVGRREVSTEAENRFLESLMSAGVQGHSANSSAILHAAGAEGDLNFLLGQKMSLDRQRPLSNPYPCWTGRDTCPTQSKVDSVQDSTIQPSKILPSMGDPVPLSSQVDLLSALQAAADKSSSQIVNSGGSGWTKFPEMRPMKSNSKSGMDVIQENLHFSSQTGLGAQQQRSQSQNQPSLSHLMGQPGDFSSAMVSLEKFSSEVPQDQQMLNLLQQQYLLNQIQLQPPAAPTQLSLLDKFLLIKQQEQEQRQQQILYQQQLLLSQVLSGQQSQFEASYGLPKAALPVVNPPLDLGLHETLQVNKQVPVPNLHVQPASSHIDLSFQASQNVDCAVSTGPSALYIPHEMFGFHAPLQGQDAVVVQKIPDSLESRPGMTLAKQDGPIPRITTVESSSEGVALHKNAQETDTSSMPHKLPSVSQSTGRMSSTLGTGNMTIPDETLDVLQSTSSIIEETRDMKTFDGKIPEKGHADLPSAKEGKSIGIQLAKKASEKKSKKQKNVKSISLKDLVKGSSAVVPNQLLKQDEETVETKAALSSHVCKNEDKSISGSLPLRVGDEKSIEFCDRSNDIQQDQLPLSSHVLAGKDKTVEVKAEGAEAEKSFLNLQTSAGHRAWKPAPGLRAKSLLEIQQEEKLKVQVETRDSETSLVAPVSIQPTSWVGVVSMDDDGKSIKDAVLEDSSTNSVSLLGRKSQLHNLLAEEGPAKFNGAPVETPSENGSLMSSVYQTCTHLDIPAFDDDDDFTEAKESKKNRKKVVKAKGSGIKSSSPTTCVDLSSYIPTLEKGKNASQLQMEKELVPPTGPSLADFVFWKEDQGNSTPALAAWSTDLGKIEKPVSLRDILREQQKKAPSLSKQIPIPAPVKAQTNQGSRGNNNNTSSLISRSSPNSKSMVQPKDASPVRASIPRSTRPKSKPEDDLFWGSLDQSKQEAKPSEFPSLMNPSNSNMKGSTAKGASVVASTLQMPSNKSGDIFLSSSPVHKGRKNAATKYSEATDFREWCEGELSRITGSKDTGFLEYCLQQSTSEAEILLTENLGSLDRNREFIDKFLNYKDLLPSDVKDIAFKTMEDGSGHKIKTNLLEKDTYGESEDGTSKVGKKKGKKGKKVMPAAVLGFNVVSNRIMMGEIQTIDE